MLMASYLDSTVPHVSPKHKISAKLGKIPQWTLLTWILSSINCSVELLCSYRKRDGTSQLWHTPLVEVNQAIFAWSFRQLDEEQGTHFNIKSKVNSLVKANFRKKNWAGVYLYVFGQHKSLTIVPVISSGVSLLHKKVDRLYEIHLGFDTHLL